MLGWYNQSAMYLPFPFLIRHISIYGVYKLPFQSVQIETGTPTLNIMIRNKQAWDFDFASQMLVGQAKLSIANNWATIFRISLGNLIQNSLIQSTVILQCCSIAAQEHVTFVSV